MNGLNFSGFTSIDFDFLMTLCSRMKDKGTNELTLTFDELKDIINYKPTSLKRFVSDIIRMNEKLMKISCALEKDGQIFQFVLFTTFITNPERKIVTIAVNERFKFILNDITKNFTRFDLEEFVRLESKYTKTLFRLLKQFRTMGKYEISLEMFRQKMDIPISYTSRDIHFKIIDPSIQELQNCFKDLKCTIQYANKRGRPVTGYIFTFKPEAIPKVMNKTADGVPQKRKTYQHKPSQKITNKFLNFEQHEYSEEELDEQERMLLERSRRKIRKLSV